jgi:hydroxymethylbilane synthase
VALRIGTRGSPLALAQAREVAELLGGAELVPIATSGDRGRGGDKARWVKEIEDALLAGDIDVAVHSAKDVPADLPDALAIAGAPARADARDVLCGQNGLDALPAGARVGTSSLRRAAQLRALREDVEVVSLKGNVDTRLRRLAAGDFDAILLAAAGLERLGLDEKGSVLDPSVMVPAPGQGVLALETRSDDAEARAAVAEVSDARAVAALAAERAVVRALGATCRTPVGAHAAWTAGGDLELTAFAGLPDGSAWLRDAVSGNARTAEELGTWVGERLLAAGADELLREADRS